MFGITIGMLGAFVVGVIITAIVIFFIYRNNKKQFIEALLNIDVIVSKYDTVEEIKSKINLLLDMLKLKKKI